MQFQSLLFFKQEGSRMFAARVREALLCLAVGVLLSACGGSPQGRGPSSASQPMDATIAQVVSTRSYVNGVYIETNGESVPAQVYRLYRAAFARTADAGGLGYQV